MGDRGYIAAGAYIRPNAQPIMDTITNTLATRSWADNGGTGTIEYLDRLLVIRQTLEIHMEVEQFLADLRAGGGQGRPSPSSFTGCGSTPDSATACWPAAQTVRRAAFAGGRS